MDLEHFSVAVTSVDELAEYLGHELICAQERDASEVLVQVYSSSCDPNWIKAIISIVGEFSVKALIVGATTVGEISEGRVKTGTTVVSLSFFSSTKLVPIVLDIPPGQESLMTEKLAVNLASLNASPTGLLMLSTPLSIDCNIVLQDLHGRCPGLPIFGGGAGDYAGMSMTYVFDKDNILDAGLVAVALVSDDLFIERHAFLGWKPVGKRMKITKAEGFTVYEIDGEPAFEVYKHYLGVKADDEFFLNALEFPLLLHRGSQVLARVPVLANPDGSITFIADIKQGEFVQLGYGDISLILADARNLQEKIKQFRPQGVYAYSCGCRRFLMQEDVELELLPLEALAPTAGFFTYGEFFDFGDQSPLLNSAIVVVAIREGASEIETGGETYLGENVTEDHYEDPYHRRHSRVLSRFLYYLESVTQELVVSNQHKSQFLSNMSHELRTPLNAIIGYTEIVLEELADKGDERSVSDLGKVITASNQLLSLVGDVLDFTKIEAGKETLNYGYISLGALMENVANTAKPQVMANGNELVVQVEDQEKICWLESKKVTQVLLNLLGNAAKFTTQGKVTLLANIQGADLKFTVQDTGLGISEEHIKTIFEEFRQVEMSHARMYGGAGLGLAISLGLTKLMGGEIDVQSEFGCGSTFTLTLPCEEEREPKVGL